jgi:hypothetical protein
VARRLVGAELDDGGALELPAKLWQCGREVGHITSLVHHPSRPGWVGLGYVKTPVPDFTGLTAGDPPRPVRLME